MMTGRRLVRLVGMFVVAVAFCMQARGAAAQVAGGQVAAAVGEGAPRAVLEQYCFSCHNERREVGGLALDALDMADVAERADVWEQVIRKLRTGAMPPAGRPQPGKTATNYLASWLEAELDRAALLHPDPGRPTLHRLNRSVLPDLGGLDGRCRS